VEFRYRLRIIIAVLAFILPMIGYGLFGTGLEAAATLATLLATIYIMGAIFLVACVGAVVERTISYIFTNKGAG
jgi:hypothetical protein